MIWLLLFLPTFLAQGCGQPRCGYVRPYYHQQVPVYQAQYVQQQVRPPPQVPVAGPQPYYTNSYVLPPQLPELVKPTDKDLATSLPDKVKIMEFEKFEKELSKLKPAATESPTIVEPPMNLTGTTYIRELPYPPQPYLPRPLPYRPHPLLPRGCPVLPPQYVRPVPYMPRGYVQPVPAPIVQPAVTAPPPPPQPVYPQPTYVRPPPLNDCCGRCAHPCQFRQRAQAKASKIVEKDFVPLRDATEVSKDSRCTSEKLREIMNRATTRTPALSKRTIQKAAEDQIGGLFSVICSREDFSYVARSEMFCQTSKNDIICYAFQHS